MDALFSAFAPSLSSSLAHGAAGALEGQMAGEDRLLKNQLTQAQIDWQRAHAAGYQHGQKTSMEAMARLQQLMSKDPNALYSPEGRMLAFGAFKFDPSVQDASAYRYNQQGESSGAHAGYFDEQAATERRIRDDKERALAGLGRQREAIAGQVEQLTTPKVNEVNSRTALNQKRGLSEDALKSLRGFQGQLAQQRADLARVQKENAAKPGAGHAPNLYSYAEMLHHRINDALEAQANGEGDGPDYNDILMLEDVRMKLRGPDYGAIPLGGEPFNKRTGTIVEPAVPEKNSMFGLGSPIPGSGKPGSPPAVKPLDVTPRTPKGARPGSPEFDQSVLKARKLIKERGKAFAESQVSTNKSLTPTERLALKEALLSEGVGE